MPQPIEFLDALFGAAPNSAITLATEGASVEVQSGDEIAEFFLGAGAEPTYMVPSTSDGILCFFHVVMENSVPDEWQDLHLRPTLVMHKDGTSIVLYALFDSTISTPSLQEIHEHYGTSVDDYIPIPGTNRWYLEHFDPSVYYESQVVAVTYAPEEKASTAASTAEDFGSLLDARVVTELDLTSPEYQQNMVISVGPNRLSTKWKNQTLPISHFVQLLAKHPVANHKDGLAFVLGEIIGDNRRKQAVTHCYGIGLDLDVGIPGAEVDEALRALGCLAVRYTTFSHRKSTSKLNKDKIVKWAAKQGIPFDGDAVIKFLQSVSKWDKRIIASAEYVGDEHEAEGVMACVRHIPMEKHRIVVPLAESFQPAMVAETHAQGMALWGDVCKSLAHVLGDLPMDNSATDPSRLFYFPRHVKGGEHETTIFGGPLLDWRSLPEASAISAAPTTPTTFEEALEGEVARNSAKGSKSKTEGGQKLGRWAMRAAHGFQIAEIIRDHCDERIRTHGAEKLDVECPFDEDHSDPGNPEDKGCFVVNAGDGPSGIFTIKCQHDSCQGKTNLDFLAKMINDQWFDEVLLEDPMYNAAVIEDAPNPKVAERIVQEDAARLEYEELIEGLNPNSSDEEVDAALRSFLQAELTGRSLQRAEQTAKKNLGMTQANFSRLVKAVRQALVQERNTKGDYKDPKGRTIFTFQGDFHFDEAVDTCFDSLLRTNQRDKEPTFSCVQDRTVRLSRNPKTGRISFDELTNRTLWSELNKRVTFVRRNDTSDGNRGSVPREVADHVFEQAYTELPQSPEIIYTPIFTANGDLVVSPGYKDELNILMADTDFHVTVPVNPSWEDVEDAVNLLREELLVDFPFLDYDTEGNERREPSEANALAMLITPFMRRMINGCTPVFFISKPTPGTGGTLLGKLPMLIFDGAESAPMRYTQNEEEMQKALLAAIIETRSHLFFDDVKDFNNRSLLQSITAQEIGGRMLGVSRNISRQNLFGWVATGNNPNVGSEMERRICWVRLNAKTADIQNRVYHHEDLPGWIADNRHRIVAAILTLIQYWIDSECPSFTERKRVSFEDWSRKVGGVLQLCGIEGFLDNRKSNTADMDETANKLFVREWLRKFAFGKVLAGQLFQYALDTDLDIIEGNNDDQKKQRFPKRLNTLDGRVFVIENVDYMVMTAIDDDGNTIYYLAPLQEKDEDAA